MIKYVCKHYPTGNCNLPNVHCAAPHCNILTADSTPDVDFQEAQSDLALATTEFASILHTANVKQIEQRRSRMDAVTQRLSYAAKAMQDKADGKVLGG